MLSKTEKILFVFILFNFIFIITFFLKGSNKLVVNKEINGGALLAPLLSSQKADKALNFLNKNNRHQAQNSAWKKNFSSQSSKFFLKSVRLDLSSMEAPDNLDVFIREILTRLEEVGANAVFVNPWSDGEANYMSRIAPVNRLGKNFFLESFIKKAQQKNIKVYAWFVVGKDNFPFKEHPNWYAKTIKGDNYLQNDGHGVKLPFASLANDDYVNYHLNLIQEVNRLSWDGWVISEPLIGWGDRYDDFYTDFSESSLKKFQQKYKVDPREIFNPQSLFFYEKNPLLYKKWINFRSQIVTAFVQKSIKKIRKNPDCIVIITLFTEPDKNGNLIPFQNLKEWLGEDICSLIKLRPDYLEIQSLFLDFEFPQKPDWTFEMIRQFKSQLPENIPLLVSVQGFNGQTPLSSQDFALSIKTAQKANIFGISFYAFHTLGKEHWEELKKLWKKN